MANIVYGDTFQGFGELPEPPFPILGGDQEDLITTHRDKTPGKTS